MKKILIIGPFPKPISGVSFANKVVKEVLDNSLEFKTDYINTSYPVFEDSVGSFSFKKAFFFLRINFNVLKVIGNDIIYITPGQTFFGIVKYTLFILLSSFLNKELIIHVHGNFLGLQYKKLGGIKKKIFYYLLSRFTKGIILSPLLKNNLTPFLLDKNIYNLYNFAENYLFKQTSKLKVEKIRVVYLSNLMKEKGVLNLLDALEKIEEKNISYEAKIAGNIDDNLKEIIKQKIEKLKNTKYLGSIYGKEKSDLLNWSNIFVLPTFYKMEGQPISILEAMATNNVIVTTKHAGIPDIVKENINGYFVEKNNFETIFNTLVSLDKDKSKILKIANNNKTYFANNYTEEHFGKELIKILQSKNAKT